MQATYFCRIFYYKSVAKADFTKMSNFKTSFRHVKKCLRRLKNNGGSENFGTAV